MNKKWWKESVVYQIYPRSFMDSNGDGIGDINGITSKLDYLKELGINVIWLSPVYQSPNDDNGYDISDYQAIMEEFGTMEDFDRMLQAAHERGIKIMMDLVVNHTSDEHAWFVESRKSKENPYRDYYIWREGKNGEAPNNWGSCFGGSAWEYDQATDMYFLHLFSKKQPDLNWDNEKVRKEVFDMMTWWLSKGVDGFRMDVISMISKVPELPDGTKGEGALYGDFGPSVINGPHVHEYLQEMRSRVLSEFDTITVGETSGVTVEEAVKYAADDESELNMVFQFEQNDLDNGEHSKWNLKKIYLPDLKKILAKWQTRLEGKAWNSLYWNNHDQPRIVSRLGNDKEYREVSAKMLATCLHMMKGTPYIYQGEELGMTNVPFASLEEFRDIESINAYHEYTENGIIGEEDMLKFLCYKSRDNARTPMQWDNSANAGFSEARPWIKVNPNYTEINAQEQLNRDDSVFHYYQKLIALRKQKEIIVYGNFELLLPEDEDIFMYTRVLEKEKLLVICNFSKNERVVKLPDGFEAGDILITNYENLEISDELKLRPYEAIVIEGRT